MTTFTESADFSSGSRDNLRHHGETIEVITGDLRDAAACRAACRDARLVFHLAALGSVPRSMDDPALMAHLAAKKIPLEICVTSNLRTGAVSSLAEHPVRRLYDAGVPLIFNTDDPAMFGCTLTGEYELAAREFGFMEKELEAIAAAARGTRSRFSRSPSSLTVELPRAPCATRFACSSARRRRR